MYTPIPPALLMFRSIGLCLAVVFSAGSFAANNFPMPDALKGDVAFWLRVYTEINTSSGFIHDAKHIAVVYETLDLVGQRRADQRSINTVKSKYASILESLADSRSNLSAEEQRVLSLWGSAVTSSQLRQAATQLRFQRGQANRFREGLARSGQWHDHIEKVMLDKGLPVELALLPHVESSFNPAAYSSAGAAGIWQFTRSTGRRYLHIDYVVDERMDPFAATAAAAQLLEHNYQLTGTWPLALTAYNHGASGVRRASKQFGTTDITTILRKYQGRTFGFASRNFYLSFLAAVEASQNPDKYFPPFQSAPIINYAEITLPDYILVDSFSRAFGTDLDTLKQHNRALLAPVWLGKKRIPQGYTMRIPQSSFNGTAKDLLASVPSDQRFTEQTPDLFHKVVPGDTVSEIASRYGHSVREIVAMNGLNKRYQIRVGQTLRLPLEGTITAVEANAGALAIAQAPAESPELPAVEERPLIETIEHELLGDPSDYTVASNHTIEVQASETLGHYAEWLDIRASDIRHLNGMRYGHPVVIGQRLKLDFSDINEDEFERRRLAFQHDLQQSFFMTWQIRSTIKHVIAPGESLWVLTQRQFKVPMWLIRQYNPDLNLDKLHPGTVIVIPELVEA